jgi:hypothetical protein
MEKAMAAAMSVVFVKCMLFDVGLAGRSMCEKMVGRLLLMLVDGSGKGSRCFERNLVVDDLVCESEEVVWRRKKREKMRNYIDMESTGMLRT